MRQANFASLEGPIKFILSKHLPIFKFYPCNSLSIVRCFFIEHILASLIILLFVSWPYKLSIQTLLTPFLSRLWLLTFNPDLAYSNSLSRPSLLTFYPDLVYSLSIQTLHIHFLSRLCILTFYPDFAYSLSIQTLHTHFLSRPCLFTFYPDLVYSLSIQTLHTHLLSRLR